MKMIAEFDKKTMNPNGPFFPGRPSVRLFGEAENSHW